MREIEGAHTGAKMASIVIDVISDFGITDLLGYISMDNASPCDVLMQELSNG